MNADQLEFNTLSSAAFFIHKLGHRVELRKVKTIQVDRYDYLCTQKPGVVLVRIYYLKTVDHCVVVTEPKRVIVDSSDTHSMALTSEVLRHSGGLDINDLKIG